MAMVLGATFTFAQKTDRSRGELGRSNSIMTVSITPGQAGFSTHGDNSRIDAHSTVGILGVLPLRGGVLRQRFA